MRTLHPSLALWAALCAAALLVPLPAQADVAGILEQARITPLTPAPASDFTLKDLSGNEQRLSDYSGRWVLLTFWATWCGPCKTEMPTLQRLHEQRAKDGFQVLAVSIDRSAGAPKKYIQSKGYTFPVVHDAGSRVAAAYQASAVPVSYLIDPAGQLVGVSRGARDWSALGSTIDRLLAAEAVDPDAEPVYSEAPVDLTPDVTPPTATVALASQPPLVAGKAFAVDVTVTWAGHLQDYILHPPKAQLPEGVALEATTAQTRSGDEAARTQVTYTLTLEAAEPGRYALDPIELRYTPHGAELQTALITGPTVDVVAPPSMLPWLAGLGAVLGLGVVGTGSAVWLRRRSRQPEPEPDALAELTAAWERARAHRVEGDIPAFLEALLPILEALGQTDEALGQALERARYGGQPPTRAELDRLSRRVERALAERTRAQRVDPAEAYLEPADEPPKKATDDSDFAPPGGA